GLAGCPGAGDVVWSGPGLRRVSSSAAVRFPAPVGQLAQSELVAEQRRRAVAEDAGHGGACAGMAAGRAQWSGSMAGGVRWPISRSWRDWALVSGSKTRRRTSWTWPGAAWLTFAWPWPVRAARV